MPILSTTTRAPLLLCTKVAVLIAAMMLRCCAAAPTLTLVGTVPLPRVGNLIGEYKFDHIDADISARTLFASLKMNNTIAVVNMNTRALVTVLSGVGAPQGLKVVPSLGLFFVAGDTDGTVHAFSLTPPYPEVWKINLGGPGGGADGIDFDVSSGLLWVGFGDITGGPFGTLAYISATATRGTWLGNVSYPLGAHPEEFHLSPLSKLLYGSCPDASSVVVVVNTATKSIVTTWPLLPLGASDNYGNELDAPRGRYYTGTYGTTPGTPAFGKPQFLVLNLYDGSLIWSMPVTVGCDSVKFDGANTIYIACGGSALPNDPAQLFIVSVIDANTYMLAGTAAMPVPFLNARSIFYDAVSGTVWLSVPFNDAVTPVQQGQLVVFQASTPSPSSTPLQPASVISAATFPPALAGGIFALLALIVLGVGALLFMLSAAHCPPRMTALMVGCCFCCRGGEKKKGVMTSQTADSTHRMSHSDFGDVVKTRNILTSLPGVSSTSLTAPTYVVPMPSETASASSSIGVLMLPVAVSRASSSTAIDAPEHSTTSSNSCSTGSANSSAYTSPVFAAASAPAPAISRGVHGDGFITPREGLSTESALESSSGSARLLSSYSGEIHQQQQQPVRVELDPHSVSV